MLTKDDMQVYGQEEVVFNDNGVDINHTFYGTSGGGGAVAPVAAQDYYAPIVDAVFYDDTSVVVPTALTPDVVVPSTDILADLSATVSDFEAADPTTLPPNTMLSTDGNVPNESGNYIPAIVQRDDTVPTATGGTAGGTPIPSIGDGAIETPTQQANNTSTNGGTTDTNAEIKTAEPITGKSNKILIILGVLLVLFIVYKLFKRQS